MAERRSLGSIAAAVAGLLAACACVGGGFYVLAEYATGPAVQYATTLGYASTNGSVITLAPTEHGYFCEVTYLYHVDGLPYDSNRTRTQGSHPYRERRHYCRAWNATRSVTVWYDPRRPERAALRRTYAGDLWVAINVLDSLALVALGGALIYWVFQRLAPLYTLACVHAAAGFFSTVPISIVRLSHRHFLALLPLFVGVGCAAVAAYCALILGGKARARRTLGNKEEDWWSHPSDVDTYLERDVDTSHPSHPLSASNPINAQRNSQRVHNDDVPTSDGADS